MYTIIVLLILGLLIFLNGEGWGSYYNITIKPHSAPGEPSPFWVTLGWRFCRCRKILVASWFRTARC